jgi:uncharacterized protein
MGASSVSRLRKPARPHRLGHADRGPGAARSGRVRVNDVRAQFLQREDRERIREAVVLPVALAYGGIAQILAGMWEFRNNNTFGATAFTSYGAFWLSLWALNEFFAPGIPKAVLGDALGLYLVSWGVFTTYMWVASLRTSVAVSLVFLLLAATFALLGIGNWTGTNGLIRAGGWVGIATAAVAWYASFAAVTNSTFGRTILPVRPLTPLKR